MAAVEETTTPAEPASVPVDYLSDPNAVLNDRAAQWRYGVPPDYSKTRSYYEATKSSNHGSGSLEQLVENLVKNWEIEASFKTQLSDWRTIDHDKYTFAINGGPPQTAQHMLKVGTYNAIVAPNEYYSPEHSDFATSHKTFKRMMPTFAWEVLEVYSGPPRVAFRWRHWGVMANDYVGFNDKGEKITAKAHNGKIDIQGVTVALVDERIRVQKLETWFDSMEMFRQIAPYGIVNREALNLDKKAHEEPVERMKELVKCPERTALAEAAIDVSVQPVEPTSAVESDDSYVNIEESAYSEGSTLPDHLQPLIYYSAVAGDDTVHLPPSEGETASGVPDKIDDYLSQPADIVHPHPKPTEEHVQPESGEAVAAPAASEETKATYEEMSQAIPAGCPFMNKE